MCHSDGTLIVAAVVKAIHTLKKNAKENEFSKEIKNNHHKFRKNNAIISLKIETSKMPVKAKKKIRNFEF